MQAQLEVQARSSLAIEATQNDRLTATRRGAREQASTRSPAGRG
jgi:hypothetical protein